MVVKVCSSSVNVESQAQRTAKRVLKKYRVNKRSPKNSKGSSSGASYWRLKRIVPTISDKENISKLDVVLEAISYIQRLQGNLQAAAAMTAAAAAEQQANSRQC